VAACCLASYIRQLGWSARAHHATNYQIILPPVLVACGLGEMARVGKSCINPELGFRFPGAVVTTDLPLVPDGPIDFGLQDFCSKCKKCVRSCPSGAIGDGDPVEGVSHAAIDRLRILVRSSLPRPVRWPR
jgi:ferredoxin